MNRIRIAIQKSGRLSERSLELLQNCGLSFARSKDKLYWYGLDFPVDLLLVRDDDIPRILLDGVCDLGIVGQNIAQEVMRERDGTGLSELRRLTFGGCRLAIAVPVTVPGAHLDTSSPRHGEGARHFLFETHGEWSQLARWFLDRSTLVPEVVQVLHRVENLALPLLEW